MQEDGLVAAQRPRGRRVWLEILQAAGFIIFLAAALFGQGESGVIYGRVTDSRGHPQQVLVSLLSAGDILAGRTYTDSDGQYIFQALPDGEYWVVVEAEGFQPVRQPVMLDSHINSKVQVYAVLEPVAAPQPPSPIVSGSAASHTVDAKKPAPVPNAKVLREFDRGNTRRQKGDLKGAVAHYEKALAMDPAFYPALNNLGAVLEQRGDHARAEQVLHQALKLDPNDGEGYVNLGHVLYEEARYQDAREQLDEGLKRSPNSATGHFFLGSVYLKLGQLDQAETNLKQASTLDPKGMPAAHLQLANVYLRAHNLAAAGGELESYLKMNPADPQAPAIRKLLASIKARNN